MFTTHESVQARPYIYFPDLHIISLKMIKHIGQGYLMPIFKKGPLIWPTNMLNLDFAVVLNALVLVIRSPSTDYLQTRRIQRIHLPLMP